MLTLHLFELLPVYGMLFFHACHKTIALNKNCERVHVRWTEKSGNKFDSIG